MRTATGSAADIQPAAVGANFRVAVMAVMAFLAAAGVPATGANFRVVMAVMAFLAAAGVPATCLGFARDTQNR